MPSKKNILFINPWIYDFTAYDFWLRPLGLLYVAALLEKYTDACLSFVDCLDRHHPQMKKRLKDKKDGRGSFFKEEVSKPDVLKAVPRKFSRYGIPLSLFEYELDRVPTPQLVLLSCTMTYWYPGIQFVIELLRKKFGNIPVVLGGVYATLLPEHARSSTGADFIVEGPGEIKIFRLLREIFGDKFCAELSFETLQEIPWPAFHFLRNTESLPLLTSRGCPFSCSYCAAPILFDGFEQTAPESVVTQIEHACHVLKARNISFYDDALVLNKQNHIHSILREVVRKKLPLAFHTPNGLHVREIDIELAALFKQANFQSIFLSQESFDEGLLKESSPKVGVDELHTALQNLEAAGYRRDEINVYLMAGMPGQDFISIKESILQLQHLGARPRLAYFSPVPGTRDWKRLIKDGYILKDADPLLHNKLAFPYIREELSPADFESLKHLINRSA